MEYNIKLMDGRIIKGYPKEIEADLIENTLELDHSSMYLTIGNQKPNGTTTQKDEKAEMEKRAFLDNAFLLLENHELIFSDSRMFLCPIPIQSGLAYTGTSGFKHPTLGVYLEWWLNCLEVNVWNQDGCYEEYTKQWLVYHLAGSPLSGSNKCSIVNCRGETECRFVPKFFTLWTTFLKINCRYDEAKANCQAYNLHHVLEILEQKGKNVVNDKNIYIHFLERRNQELEKNVQNITHYAEHLLYTLKQTLVQGNEKKLKAMLADYRSIDERNEKRLSELRSIRIELRKRKRSGEIDSVQYQKIWKPYGKEMRFLKYEADRFAEKRIRQMMPQVNISIREIEQHLLTSQPNEESTND